MSPISVLVSFNARSHSSLFPEKSGTGLPNASVPKTLVRHLVRYYADTCGDAELAAVLYDILDTPVSPELLPPTEGQISQKTEDLVGPYELHDFFMYYILRYGYRPSKIYRLAKIAFKG